MNSNTGFSHNSQDHDRHTSDSHGLHVASSDFHEENANGTILKESENSASSSVQSHFVNHQAFNGANAAETNCSTPVVDQHQADSGAGNVDGMDRQSKVYPSGFADEEFPYDEWLNSNAYTIAVATGNADVSTVMNAPHITENSNSSSSGVSGSLTPIIKEEPDQLDDLLSPSTSGKTLFDPEIFPRRTFSGTSSFNSPTVSPPGRRTALSADDPKINNVPISNSNSASSSSSKRVPPKLLRGRRAGGASSGSAAISEGPSSNSDTSSVGARSGSYTGSGVKKPKRDRFSHNVVEKKYRTNINMRIAELRNAVPTLKPLSTSAGNGQIDLSKLDGLTPATRLNKASILSKATEYIYHLRTKNEALMREVSALHGVIQQYGLSLPPAVQEMHQQLKPLPKFINYSHDGKKLGPVSGQPPAKTSSFRGLQQQAQPQAAYGYYGGVSASVPGATVAYDTQYAGGQPLANQYSYVQKGEGVPQYVQKGQKFAQYVPNGSTAQYVQDQASQYVQKQAPQYGQDQTTPYGQDQTTQYGQNQTPYIQKDQMHYVQKDQTPNYIPKNKMPGYSQDQPPQYNFQHQPSSQHPYTSSEPQPGQTFQQNPEHANSQQQNFYYDQKHEIDTVGQPIEEPNLANNASESHMMRGQMLVGGVAAIMGSQLMASSEESIPSHTQDIRPMGISSVWLDIPETVSSFKTLCQFTLFFLGLFMLVQPVLSVCFDFIEACLYPPSLETNHVPGFVQTRIRGLVRRSSGFAFTTLLVKYWAVNCGFLIKDGTNPQHLYQFNMLCHDLFTKKGQIPLAVLMFFYVESLSIVTSGAYRTDESYRFQFNSLVIARVFERRLRSQFLNAMLSIPQRICALFKELEATKAIRGERSASMCQMVKLIEKDPGFVASNVLFDRILTRSFKMEESWYLVEYVCFIRATDILRASLIEYIQALSLFGGDILPGNEAVFSKVRHREASYAKPVEDDLSYKAFKETIMAEVVHRIFSKIDKSEAIMPAGSPVRLYCSVYQQILDPTDKSKLQRSLYAIFSSCKRHLENSETFDRVNSLFEVDKFKPQDMDVIVEEIESHQHPSAIMHVVSCFSYRLSLACSWIMHFYYNSDYESARYLVKFLRTPSDFANHGDLEVLDLLPFTAALQVLLVIVEKEADNLFKDESEGGLGDENLQVITNLVNFLKVYVNYAVAAPKKFNLLSYDVARLRTQLKLEIHQRLMRLGNILDSGSAARNDDVIG